jgi:hypothetical protein
MIKALGYLKNVSHKKEGTVLTVVIPSWIYHCGGASYPCVAFRPVSSGRSRIDVKITATEPLLPESKEEE